MNEFYVEPEDVYCDQVNENLKHFLKYFVEEFEEKLALYSLELNGKLKKAGKSAKHINNALVGLIGFVSGKIPMVGGVVKSVSTDLIADEINKIGEEYHLKKVINLSGLVDSSQEVSDHFRDMIIKSGIDVFQSFELQFMRVTPRSALRLLARDAVDRAINYMEGKEQFDEGLIAKGVVLGKSKGFSFRGKSITSGFKIKYRYNNEEKSLIIKKNWNTTELYSKVGIVIISENKDGTGYYRRKDQKSNTGEYGYRRLLKSENWDELKKEYEDDSITGVNKQQFTNYNYITSTNLSEDLENDSKMLSESISEIASEFISLKDENLMEKRIKERLGEIQANTIHEIRELKKLIIKLGNYLSNNIKR
ncbi:MAG: hypothetical protein sL5_00010 [Candidatus Mesenet longicola]|uniref:Uncharacterized protein n=1 Tax=Candidatus Mesenet longicola TaxID=1892558 RepID=A0A8J3HNX8_9RICK|nr:MAG: hypothetical protein sGL2_00540 [Candidatus Mesenet longicola]GHM59008.1 MAG: hypothetical protein sL5_00010 [Candidatus Mesenet longicola]